MSGTKTRGDMIFSPEEIEVARDHLSDAAICLIEHGFNPTDCAEEIEGSAWVMGNAFRQGYVQQDNAAAHRLLDKLEG